MASRYGRKKRRAAREQIEALTLAGKALAHENAILADRAIVHAEARHDLAERVAAWDAEICFHLGDKSALRLEPAVLVTDARPHELQAWPVVGMPVAAFVDAAMVPVVQSHAEKLFHVLVNASEVDRLKYQRLISMAIVSPGGAPAKEMVYAISESAIGKGKKLGLPQINYIASQIARVFRERLVAEMGR